MNTITRDQFNHLAGNLLTIAAAAEKYNVPQGTIKGWLYKARNLTPVGRYPAKIDEADFAYLATVYHARPAGSKAPLLNADGSPYALKLPDLAAYRRRKRDT